MVVVVDSDWSELAADGGGRRPTEVGRCQLVGDGRPKLAGRSWLVVDGGRGWPPTVVVDGGWSELTVSGGGLWGLTGVGHRQWWLARVGQLAATTTSRTVSSVK